jgi:predicted TPR repeat methyltransferase
MAEAAIDWFAPMPVRLPTFVSSGDLLADRRFDYAMGLKSDGELSAASDLLREALDLAPGWATAWHALGEIRVALDDRDGAIAALEQALACDPEDRHGAAVLLARLGARPIEGAMSAGYVRAVFDEYANTFDRSLVEDLNYCGPQLLRAALDRLTPGRRFGSVLDLGCGTGLAGKALHDLCDVIDGVDLSRRMIAWARMTGCYRDLIVGDMLAAVQADAPGSRYLIIAADAFVYLADLAPIVTACARALSPDGRLAFTVETHPDEGVMLGETWRYRHGRSHVEAVLTAAGLRILALDAVSTREELGQPVPCLLVVAVK